MRFAALAVMLMLGGAAVSADPASVRVDAAWSRALPPVSENGAAYVTVTNLGVEPDALVGADTPMAERAELHEHVMQGGLMKMRKVASVALAPGDGVAMEPGGLHVMLMQLAHPLAEGASFPLTLHFRNAPDITVNVSVMAMGATPDAMHQMHGGHGKKKH